MKKNKHRAPKAASTAVMTDVRDTCTITSTKVKHQHLQPDTSVSTQATAAAGGCSGPCSWNSSSSSELDCVADSSAVVAIASQQQQLGRLTTSESVTACTELPAVCDDVGMLHATAIATAQLSSGHTVDHTTLLVSPIAAASHQACDNVGTPPPLPDAAPGNDDINLDEVFDVLLNDLPDLKQDNTSQSDTSITIQRAYSSGCVNTWSDGTDRSPLPDDLRAYAYSSSSFVGACDDGTASSWHAIDWNAMHTHVPAVPVAPPAVAGKPIQPKAQSNAGDQDTLMSVKCAPQHDDQPAPGGSAATTMYHPLSLPFPITMSAGPPGSLALPLDPITPHHLPSYCMSSIIRPGRNGRLLSPAAYDMMMAAAARRPQPGHVEHQGHQQQHEDQPPPACLNLPSPATLPAGHQADMALASIPGNATSPCSRQVQEHPYTHSSHMPCVMRGNIVQHGSSPNSSSSGSSWYHHRPHNEYNSSFHRSGSFHHDYAHSHYSHSRHDLSGTNHPYHSNPCTVLGSQSPAKLSHAMSMPSSPMTTQPAHHHFPNQTAGSETHGSVVGGNSAYHRTLSCSSLSSSYHNSLTSVKQVGSMCGGDSPRLMSHGSAPVTPSRQSRMAHSMSPAAGALRHTAMFESPGCHQHHLHERCMLIPQYADYGGGLYQQQSYNQHADELDGDLLLEDLHEAEMYMLMEL